MRTLIVGGSGMLGHQLLKQLSLAHDARVTLHSKLADYSAFGLFNAKNSYPGIELSSIGLVAEVIEDFHPDAIINAAGIVKQRQESEDTPLSLEINTILPHKLAHLCNTCSARLIHISTDCVFSGARGNYKETDLPDAHDSYGMIKLLGEVNMPRCVTLRTSIIGKELLRKFGLLEWFLAQRGVVHGYKNAIFSGFTTHELSRIIEMILTGYQHASGIYHVSSDPISKLDLLTLINAKLDLNIKILPDYEFKCNRSLDSSRFRKDFNYTPPSWDAMLEELAQDYREKT